ncbi:M48 family metallopeptidase [candidate division WWE3 bacterium]|nr:M48 family metallopeptidase [candidate division WWE3 bacterium]
MQSTYSHITENKRATIFVMFGFMVVISFIGWFIGEFYFDGAGVSFIGLAMVFSGISSFISYYNSDKIVLAISGAKEVDFNDNPELYHLVENMCIAAGLVTKPKIYLIEDSAPNAFATGRDPQHAVICFTSGILSKLEKRELEGVIAHELSHIINYDILLMSIVSILVGTITLMADWFTRGIFYGGNRRRSSNSESGLNGIILIVGLILVILSPIIATLIKLAVSRRREYLADASSAMLTRYPKGLADALVKISGDTEVLEAANGATAHLYIANPLKGGHDGFFSSLFNTHPPVQERVKKLLSM